MSVGTDLHLVPCVKQQANVVKMLGSVPLLFTDLALQPKCTCVAFRWWQNPEFAEPSKWYDDLSIEGIQQAVIAARWKKVSLLADFSDDSYVPTGIAELYMALLGEDPGFVADIVSFTTGPRYTIKDAYAGNELPVVKTNMNISISCNHFSGDPDELLSLLTQSKFSDRFLGDLKEAFGFEWRWAAAFCT